MERFDVKILTHSSSSYIVASRDKAKVKIAGIFQENEYVTF